MVQWDVNVDRMQDSGITSQKYLDTDLSTLGRVTRSLTARLVITRDCSFQYLFYLYQETEKCCWVSIMTDSIEPLLYEDADEPVYCEQQDATPLTWSAVRMSLRAQVYFACKQAS